MKSKLLILKMVSLAAVSVLSVSCQKGSSSKPAEPQYTKSGYTETVREVLSNGVIIEIRKAVELRNDRSNYTQFKKSLNVYETKITIPENIFSGDIEISRSFNASSLNPSFEIVSKGDAELINNEYVIIDRVKLDDEDLIKKNVTYKVHTNEELNGESSATLIPDLIIEASKTPVTLNSMGITSGRYEFGTLVLEQNSVLRTEGATVEFNVERLIVDNALVETFSEDFAWANPGLGKPGINGGVFTLNAHLAVGHFEIIMRGTKGGEGFPAKIQSGVGSAGANGANGKRVKGLCEHIGKNSYSSKMSTESLNEPDIVVCEYDCYDPKNGEAGGVGPAGFDGGAGMAGGSSGKAIINVDEELEAMEGFKYFNVAIQNIPGEGGLGGAGSLGGEGGAGGAAGVKADQCGGSAQPGAKGAQGPAGARGEKGSKGHLEENSGIVSGKKVF